MSQELKPCPFCGNEHPEIASGDSVVCNTDGHTGCGCSAFFDLWNNRIPGPATAAMLARCQAWLAGEPALDWPDVARAFIEEWKS